MMTAAPQTPCFKTHLAAAFVAAALTSLMFAAVAVPPAQHSPDARLIATATVIETGRLS
jgi:hypothetical protein